MKLILSTLIVSVCFFITTAMSIDQVPVQTAAKSYNPPKAIPADVMKITDKSCVMCHAAPGNFFILSKLNLTKWDKYSTAKQARKAKKMCKMVSQGRMPPKKIRNKYPDSIPTKAEIKIICDWAQSLSAGNK